MRDQLSREDRPSKGETAIPLVVDLDGSLLTTDILWESVLELLKTRPLVLLFLPFWVLKGKAYVKRQVARRVELEPSSLPCNTSVVAFLEREVASGRPLILATASDELSVLPIAEYYGMFSVVLSSNGQVNLRGAEKLKAVRSHLGPRTKFDYLGDAGVDLPLWEAARSIYLAQPSGRLQRRAERVGKIEGVFERRHNRTVQLFRGLRIHQWVKNLLVFAPLLLAHQVSDLEAVIRAVVAFFSFSLCASGVYVVNDLIDLETDRQHPKKKERPLASATLQIKHALALAPLVVLSGLAIALVLLPLAFVGILGLYLAISTIYSTYLKRLVLVDVIALASLYVLRIFAGGVAVGVSISEWLLAFSMFFFLGLALLKRYAELRLLSDDKKSTLGDRGYAIDDQGLLRDFGTASGFVSILVLALYTTSDQVVELYSRPWFLWFVGPLLLYWIGKMWFAAERGEMHEDPVMHAIQSPTTYLVGAAIIVIALLAAASW